MNRPLISPSRLLAAAILLASSPAIAATFTVTNTGNDGTGSLRQALGDAQVAGGANTIVFSLPGITQPIIQLTTGSLNPPDNTTILNDRPGDVPVTIQTEPPPSLRYWGFYILENRRVLLSGLTVTGPPGGIRNQGGLLTLRNCTLSGNDNYFGGALHNIGGEATLINCLVTGNRGTQGGGLYNDTGGKMSLQHCTISDNTAELGGGIQNWAGELVLIDCTVSGNMTTGIFAGGRGGAGINNNSGVLAMANCTFSGNQNTPYGAGAIFTAGPMTANNCTFVNNRGELGGAIHDYGSSASSPSILSNCTFSGNSAVSSDGLPNSGGAIYSNYQYIASGLRTIRVNNCTFSDNSVDAISVAGPNTKLEVVNSVFRRGGGQRNVAESLGATLTSLGHNLSDDNASGDAGSGPGGLLDGPGDIRNTDPLLGPLTNNGGATQTHPLLQGSAAIESGDDAQARPRDQRGYTRNGNSDIGAYEFGGTVPVARLANISTRVRCLTNDSVLIAGFIITGTQGKKVLLRAIGPSLAGATHLDDPTLELRDPSGQVLAFNGNWMDASNRQQIIDSTIPPTNGLESAILMTLPPGAYTAIVSGANNSTGIALAELYDLDPGADSRFGNISSRGFVQTGDDVMIGGFIVVGPDSQAVVVRAIGPSLPVPEPLANPELELYDGNGSLITYSYDWRREQEGEILVTGIAPSNDLECAMVATLVPGNYTAIVRGTEDTTGIAVVEVYGVD